LGKALGGGLLPVSLFLSRQEVMDVFTPGDHGSTFGGNPLAAAVGLAAVNVLLEENLSARAAELGKYFQAKLKNLHSPWIKEVRGKGLLIGVEVRDSVARHLCMRLLKHGILTKETHASVIRFAPPLIITEEQIDTTLHAINQVLTEVA
jgi:ornithine--oxo-acid transaminase